jgi:hypothetical protein
VPPRPPHGPSPPPWHPAVLVPEDAVPDPAPPPASFNASSAIDGKGMWIWKYKSTEKGDADAIVAKAVSAHLHQLWVRVADSQDGFYAADALAQLVPRAHRAGLAVIGWGFPYLYDPVADAAWTQTALEWRAADGGGLDGFSPDIETDSEGVMLTAKRAATYLGLVRQWLGARPLVATVYRPTDKFWLGSYPYHAIAPYVEAMAPMVYWGCTEPGDALAQTIQRLGQLRPLHVIGQAYDMAEDGGRAGAPSGAEIWRFLDVAERGGAVGASFWVWQDASSEEWQALRSFRW